MDNRKALHELLKEINDENTIIRLRDNESISLPIYYRKGDTVYYSIFIYYANFSPMKSHTEYTIKGIWLFDSDDFSTTKPIQVMTDELCVSSFFHSPPIEAVNVEIWKDTYASTIDLLENMKSIVFVRDNCDKKMILSFWQHFYAIIPEGIRGYYYSIYRDFFDWANTIVGG